MLPARVRGRRTRHGSGWLRIGGLANLSECKVPAGARLQVVMEPTRNTWVPLAAWFRARGATVILLPRRYVSETETTDFWASRPTDDPDHKRAGYTPVQARLRWTGQGVRRNVGPPK
ncbi:MAG TPA: hypothetical protein VJN19_09575, partial [Propionibacteriaceae bacterium]|nr:hypothetical protein [Propionibacteriaceae bacterium]